MDRHAHIERRRTETSAECDQLVSEAKPACRAMTHVQNDLATLNVLSRHMDTFDRGVDHDMRRLHAVADPLVHRTQQIGTSRLDRRLSHYACISCSRRERLCRNAGREKMRLAYFEMTGAC